MSFSSTKQAFNAFPKQNQKLFHNFSLAKKNFDGKFLLDLYTSSDLSSNYMKRRFLYQRKQKFKSQIKNSSRGQAKVDIFKKSMIKENYQSISKQSSLKQSIIAAQKQYRKGRQTQQQEKIQEYGNYRAAKVHLLQKSMFISNEHRRRQTTKKKIDSMMKIRKSQPLMKTPLKVNLQQFLPLKKIIQQQFNTQQISQKKLAVQAQSITILKHNINIYSKQGERRKQIASLTKIMTCICVLYLSEKHQVSLQATEAKVSRNASTLGGTTANLKHGDVVFLIDLLYGMMLPSGNDAAQTLAQFFGRLIYKKSPDYLQRLKQVSKIQQALNFQSPQKKEFIYISSSIAITSFLNQMNGIAKYLQMEKTYFTNCHGLSDIRNKSCSNDVAKLCYHCMKNQKFREIVNKKIHIAKIFNKNTKMSRIQKWMNTNLNLNGKNCFGIKTGNTPNAGPCLASYFQDSSSQSDLQIIIVLIKAKSKASRFQQVQKMFEFFQKKLSCQQSSRRFQSFQQF